uniref:Uncharacterized protein n=1 Tax=Siphoviridae sp. ct2hZ16 TaxID=2826276 RepID=A0A8S5QVA8_9CAUD|nr:MAG TPA: hypothetical protein [Siphoviridae sp. ct2hZ16]
MRKRPLRLEKYGISQNRYGELYYFCKQYEEMRQKLSNARGLDAVSNDGMPHGNGISDPTARKADAAIKLSEDIRIIEDTAKEVDPMNWKTLLKNIIAETPYEHMVVYCGRRQFYDARIKFFCLLNDKKG